MAIGVALIGGGIWAREEHLPAIQASSDLTLKAVFSRTLKSANSIADSVPEQVDCYADDSDVGYDEILKRTDIDALIIALPIKNQESYIRSALLAGKHVLSEKPVAENVDAAVELIKWYRSEIKNCTWCVAENYRFLKVFETASEEAKSLGRIIGFQVRQNNLMPDTAKWWNTDWRKDPTHQGGFILDGGVHYTAGLRRLLETQPGNNVATVSAFSTQITKHLPPVDTVDAIFQLESGMTGTFGVSVGTTLRESSWTLVCEKGWVKIVGKSDITVCRDGKETTLSVTCERTGVPPEVREWGRALVAGKVLKEQEPEPALADLELIEVMLKSGEASGTPLKCAHQNI